MSDGEDHQEATAETKAKAARSRALGPGTSQAGGGDKVNGNRDTKIRTSTLWQPWATLVAKGLKTVETRTNCRLWRNMKGRTLAIHAGLQSVDDAWRGIAEWNRFIALTVKDRAHLWPRGAILAVCRVADVRLVTGDEDNWRETSRRALIDARQWCCIELADVHEFDEPIPMRGRQGIWSWDVPPVRAAEIVAAGFHVGL